MDVASPAGASEGSGCGLSIDSTVDAGAAVRVRIAAELAAAGLSIADDLIAPLLVAALASEARALRDRGGFRPAGTGRGAGFRLDAAVRGDHVRWIDPASLSDAQRELLAALEALRLAINQTLFLGLFEVEVHLAVYPPGAFYRKHLDRFRGVENRIVTCVLYLNRDWRSEDGGALRIYRDPDDIADVLDILPEGGRLVTFMSERFPHEVLPARRERLSATGWLKQRGGIGC